MLTRPSDLSLTQTTSTSSSDPLTVAPGSGSGAPEPTFAGAEDTTLITGEKVEQTAGLVKTYHWPDNDRRAAEKSEKDTKELEARQDVVLQKNQREDAALDAGHENGREEEVEEMTQERLQSLLEDLKLEGGSEDEEMTEERVSVILEQLRQAEKVVSSVPGWRSEASSAAAESTAPGHSPSTEEGRWDCFSFCAFTHQGSKSDQQFSDSSSIYLPVLTVQLIHWSSAHPHQAGRMEVRLTQPESERKSRQRGQDLRRTAAQRDQAENKRREATGPSTKSR